MSNLFNNFNILVEAEKIAKTLQKYGIDNNDLIEIVYKVNKCEKLKVEYNLANFIYEKISYKLPLREGYELRKLLLITEQQPTQQPTQQPAQQPTQQPVQQVGKQPTKNFSGMLTDFFRGIGKKMLAPYQYVKNTVPNMKTTIANLMKQFPAAKKELDIINATLDNVVKKADADVNIQAQKAQQAQQAQNIQR